MVVDMLRSCYKTKVRLFNADPTQSNITWYFVTEASGKLPFPTTINSLNWRDQSEREVDDPTRSGEVVGATRRYYAGTSPPGLQGLGPCGNAANFVGDSPPGPAGSGLPNLPDCCGQTAIGVQSTGQGNLLTSWIPPGSTSPLTGDFGLNSANAAYYWAQGYVDAVLGLFTYQVDLFVSPPSGDWDNLTDGVLATNPGVTSQVPGTSGAVYYDPIANTQNFDMYPAVFHGSDLVGSSYPKTCYGWVISDGFGSVLSWNWFGGPTYPVIFNSNTDTLTANFTNLANADYP